MKVGIVGSRRFPHQEIVEKFVDTLSKDDVVVSGGAKGPDSWSEKRAKVKGLKTLIFRPKIMSNHRGDRLAVIESYYQRNKEIAENSDIVHAFVVDKKGGTWNTIKWALKFGKQVVVHEKDKIYKLTPHKGELLKN